MKHSALLLLAMLLPSLQSSIERAEEAACGSNTRQIGAGMVSYNIEWRYLPASYPRYAAASVRGVTPSSP